MMVDEEQDMHRQVNWLKPSDRPILAQYRRYGVWLKPASATLNVGYTQQHVQERCRGLWRRGLLERHNPQTAGYRLTELGKQFLDDELTVEDLQTLTLSEEGAYAFEE